jgi:tRNA pseudouridine38-40 synthase
MPTYKLIISYDGSKYAGWQTQVSRQSPSGRLTLSSVVSHQKKIKPKLKTIQQEVEVSLGKIFQKKIKVEGSGRTDSGVHAMAQVAHFKADRLIEDEKLKNALNGILPKDIVVLRAQKTRDGFHARFDARAKTYRYVIINASTRPLFVSQYGYWVRFPLDVPLMRKEARSLVGKHNFKSFQASDKAKRSVQTTIYHVRIRKGKALDSFPFLKGMNLVLIDIEAKGFLRGMVRNIVGTLCDIARGRLPKGSLEKILMKKDRRAAGLCAPAQGLYLLKVDYDE